MITAGRRRAGIIVVSVLEEAKGDVAIFVVALRLRLRGSLNSLICAPMYYIVQIKYVSKHIIFCCGIIANSF
jgi:hypothetical protein